MYTGACGGESGIGTGIGTGAQRKMVLSYVNNKWWVLVSGVCSALFCPSFRSSVRAFVVLQLNPPPLSLALKNQEEEEEGDGGCGYDAETPPREPLALPNRNYGLFTPGVNPQTLLC